MKKNAFFIIFEGLSLKQIFFLEVESPTLRLFCFKATSCMMLGAKGFVSSAQNKLTQKQV